MRLPELLFVDADAAASDVIPTLRTHFRVTQVETVAASIEHLRRTPLLPDFVIADLELSDGNGTAVCRAAKELLVPSTVLMTTVHPEHAPDALLAGCDAVLLKPYVPNLLFARLGRLKRGRTTEMTAVSDRALAKSHHLRERSRAIMTKTQEDWPDKRCPYCAHRGVTMFDFVSHRRAWFACLACRKVWISRRPRDLE